MLLELLKQYSYFYIFLLMIVEGPIVGFLSAGLAAQWFLDIKIIILIAWWGDVVMDILLYSVGRFSHLIPRFQRFWSAKKKQKTLVKYFHKKPFLYLIIVKFTPYLASPWLIFAGRKKLKFFLYLLYVSIIAVGVKALYLILWYFGVMSINQFIQFGSSIKEIVGYVVSIIIIFVWAQKLYRYLAKKIVDDIKEKK